MFYALLGRIVWWVAKRYVRHRYKQSHLPKPVLALSVVATMLGGVLFARNQTS
jgi:hypothetical protein